MPLAMSLSIFDHEPPGSPGGQIWKGGATDLGPRTMLADPARWLTVTDHRPDEAPLAQGRPALLHWDLTQINPGVLHPPRRSRIIALAGGPGPL